jgi:alanine or glycine:cation symporter, AGCS family
MNMTLIFTAASTVLAAPTAFVLLVGALYFTVITGFLQFRSFGRFFKLLTGTIAEKKQAGKNAINPFSALFTAMSTSLGMGTIVGPSVAIVTGGPGALFWMIVYALLSAATKFAEVTYAVHFRKKTTDGLILGGPMQYLNYVHPALAAWYTGVTIFLFTAWSGLQANVLAETFSKVHIPTLATGICIAFLALYLLEGGAQRIGRFNSALVPVMFVLYVSSTLFILFTNAHLLADAFRLIFEHSFAPMPALGGFLGASVYTALQAGTYKGAFITESGMGTSSIPHSMANVAHPTDQGVLAMVSVFVDSLIMLLSGLCVLTSGVWQQGMLNNTMMYTIFNSYMPTFGKIILVSAISMFIIGTVIGNSFNGRQSFAALTNYRYLRWYNITVTFFLFLSTMMTAPLAWAIADFLLPLVAVPNVFGVMYLAYKYPDVLKKA